MTQEIGGLPNPIPKLSGSFETLLENLGKKK